MARPERHIKLGFLNQTFNFYPGKITPRLARECRKTFGDGPSVLWSKWFTSGRIEVDQAAEMLWVARKQTAELTGAPVEMTLDQLDDLLTTDSLDEHFTCTFEGWGFGEDEEAKPEIDKVAEVDDEGRRVVDPDPEG